MEENPSQAIYTNIGGTKNLADLSCLYNVKKFVMISTDKAVNLVMLWRQKRIAEKYVQSLSLKTDNTESVVLLDLLLLVLVMFGV
jgi:FlaA1/EpsC-like NDP-sugar epimerase